MKNIRLPCNSPTTASPGTQPVTVSTGDYLINMDTDTISCQWKGSLEDKTWRACLSPIGVGPLAKQIREWHNITFAVGLDVLAES